MDRDDQTIAVVEGLKKLYHTKLKPLEETYMFDFFHSPLLTDCEFDSKPHVLMIGQYSTGKTSFIRYLLGRDFPGQRIGPEPTTDRFVAVMDGPDERVVPGPALTVSPNLPYTGLDKYGVSFLNKFEASTLPSPVLRNITIIDSPGVLSGEKQRVSRGYDFVEVCHWFAERSDLILLLFDAHKLDISDEFKATIDALKGHDDKIRCVLNKADQVDRQKLMRVYGALMWSMGKIIKTPEVLRVYTGSFWDEPLMYDDNAALFDMEERDLMNDLRGLPRNSAVRKINELVKRCRLAKVHAYLIGYLRGKMPNMMGKEKAQKNLINDLPAVFRTVMKQHNLAAGDFPDLNSFRDKLLEMNFSKFPKLKPKMLEDLDTVLKKDIPRLMEMLPRTAAPTKEEQQLSQSIREEAAAKASAMDVPVPERRASTPAAQPPVPPPSNSNSDGNPFQESSGGRRASANGALGGGGVPWALEDEVAEYQDLFYAAEPVDGRVDANNARVPLLQTGLPTDTLRVLWDLADIDQDGELDIFEFTIAMHLSGTVKAGESLPDRLPLELVPPSKRHLLG